MAKIIDLDKIKAGVDDSVIVPGEPVTRALDGSCGVDWSCVPEDNPCSIDYGPCNGPDAGCIIDYACGTGNDEAACILQDYGC